MKYHRDFLFRNTCDTVTFLQPRRGGGENERICRRRRERERERGQRAAEKSRSRRLSPDAFYSRGRYEASISEGGGGYQAAGSIHSARALLRSLDGLGFTWKRTHSGVRSAGFAGQRHFREERDAGIHAGRDTSSRGFSSSSTGCVSVSPSSRRALRRLFLNPPIPRVSLISAISNARFPVRAADEISERDCDDERASSNIRIFARTRNGNVETRVAVFVIHSARAVDEKKRKRARSIVFGIILAEK